MLQRQYYSNTIKNFIVQNPLTILGEIISNSKFSVEQTQRDAWLFEITSLQKILQNKDGRIFLSFLFQEWEKELTLF